MSLRTDIIRALDPVELWEALYHTEPDPWQAAVLRSDHRRIVLCTSRQVGKSTVVATKALHLGLYTPGSLILLVSRSLRQSGELARKVFSAYRTLQRPVPPESESRLALELSNGSRIIALPGGDEGGIRGYSSVSALIIDEAARCPDQLYAAMRPSIAVSGGSITLLSTPFGRRGFFYRVWAEEGGWLKVEVPANKCPRLAPEFLQQERISLGEDWFRQEYLTEFVAGDDQIFSDESIDAAFRSDIEPLFPDDVVEDSMLTDVPPLFTGEV
jgi:terminase large subunit-like protein